MKPSHHRHPVTRRTKKSNFLRDLEKSRRPALATQPFDLYRRIILAGGNVDDDVGVPQWTTG